MNDFQIISKLGEGAYSTVYKVKRLVDDKVYALKKVKLLNLSEKEKLNSLNEVRILASVKSNFVISYKEAFFDEKDSTLGIVMEYADKGDLYQKIIEHKKTAKFFEESDIWSLGCVLYEMITLKPPFRAENMEGLFHKVIKGKINKIPDRFSDDLFSIVKLLLQVNSDNRPSCDRILKNIIVKKRIEYFNSFNKTDEDDEDQNLLRTIKMPKNLLFLSDKLPKPNYDKHIENMKNSNSKTNIKNYRSYTNKKEIENKIPPIKREKSSNGKIEKIGDKRLEKDLNELQLQRYANMKENDNSISNIYLNIREDSSRDRKGNNYNYKGRGQIDISSELPQLNNNSPRNNINQRKIINKKNKNHLDELYKIYAPSLKPIIKYNKYKCDRNQYNYAYNYSGRRENNFENSHNYPILEISNSNIQKAPENKVIPKKRLSPIRRNIINIC